MGDGIGNIDAEWVGKLNRCKSKNRYFVMPCHVYLVIFNGPSFHSHVTHAYTDER